MKASLTRTLVVSLALLSLASCGKQVTGGNQSAQYLASLNGPGNGSVGVGGGTIDTGPVVCKVYDLSAYFKAAGCGNQLNTTDAATNLALPLTPPTQLVNCGIRLPDFGALESVGSVRFPKFDVPTTDWAQGFPAFSSRFLYLKEFYGMSCTGRINVPANGPATITLTSDDGSKLSIDGVVVIDNDGLHSTQSKTMTTPLAKGSHRFKLDWYQGPRSFNALQLLWKLSGDPNPVIIPESAYEPVIEASCP
jgi:hypothetical protein